jgi:hypothetical protein
MCTSKEINPVIAAAKISTGIIMPNLFLNADTFSFYLACDAMMTSVSFSEQFIARDLA